MQVPRSLQPPGTWRTLRTMQRQGHFQSPAPTHVLDKLNPGTEPYSHDLMQENYSINSSWSRSCDKHIYVC